MSIAAMIQYVYTTLMVALPVFIVIAILRVIYLEKKNRTHHLTWRRELGVHCFIMYMVSLYEITAIRFGLGLSMENMMMRQTRVSLEPMVVLLKWLKKGIWWHLFYNVVGNCVWFIPMGILVPALFKKQRKLWKVTMIGAFVSSSIEILQYILCTGVTDIDDVIFNTLGTIIGYCIWKVLKKLFKIK
nr:VanZ family protein [uncultured Cellulosilyticum sp.]